MKKLAIMWHTIGIIKRLIAVKIVSEWNTIADAAKILRKSYQTVHRWIKTCEKEGLKGLKPSFGGRRPSKLTYNQIDGHYSIIDGDSSKRNEHRFASLSEGK